MNYGYIRVSSTDQNEDRQLIALTALDIPKRQIYIDKKSGKDFDRPAYKRMLRRLKPDDVIYITSIDRLGRNYEEIQEQWREITRNRKADIVVLDMPLLDTRRGKDLIGTFIADLVLQVLSFVAESERNNIKQRQAEGIAAAKARGVKFGRPRIERTDRHNRALEKYKSGLCTSREAALYCGVSHKTLLRWSKEEDG